MIHQWEPLLLPKKCLGAPGISYAGGRSELDLVPGEGLRVSCELLP